MNIADHLLYPVERTFSHVAGERVARGVREFLVFGVKQAAACVFAGSFLLMLAISGHVAIPGLARYDFLFLSAIALRCAKDRLRNTKET